MLQRRLGKTNEMVSVINIGGCGPGYADQEDVDPAIQMAIDAGINMIDVAPTYGEAEIRLRPWMDMYRDQFFLAEKTTKRTKEEAWQELNESMKRLGVDKFDLYQFHAVPSVQVLDQILGPGGAMEAFLEAKESDIIEYIGITGHDDIRVFIEALKRFDFDTVLAPVSLAHEFDPHPANDFHPLLELAISKDVGIQAIKSISKQRWEDPQVKHKFNTWYEPLEKQQQINLGLWYTLSQKGVTTAPMSCDVKLWPKIIEAAKSYNENDLDMEQIIKTAREQMELKPLFPHN